MPKKPSASFRKVRKQNPPASESFRNDFKLSEKTPDHTLSVREVAKILENKGVARTERSIINWCRPNRQGLTRLDCYYEENDGKYYITAISVERVIAEEQNKQQMQAKSNLSEANPAASEIRPAASEPFGNESNDFGSIPNVSETGSADASEQELNELKWKNRDLEISNKAKELYIEQLQSSNDKLLHQLTGQSHRIGVLETELKLLQAPRTPAVQEKGGPEVPH